MKKLLVVFLSMMMVLTIAGCTKQNEEEPKNVLEKIQKQGYIVVGTEGDWSPWCYYENDKLTGFEVELAKLMASELGVDVQFKDAPFDSLLLGVNSGVFDIICNGVGWTEQRAESMEFSKPYAYDNTVLIVNADDESIKSFDDLNGKRTGNSEGSTYALLGEQYKAQVVTIDKFSETILALNQGRIDATINSSLSLADYMSQHPEATVKIVATTDSQKICWPVKKGETELIEAVNKALDKLSVEGKITDLSIQFFGIDITK